MAEPIRRADPAPGDSFPPSSKIALEAALGTLQGRKRAWARLGIDARLRLLRRVRSTFLDVAERWVEACMEAEGLRPDSANGGEEWVAGPYLVLRNLRLLECSLEDIRRYGAPKIPGPVRTREDGRATARIFPFDVWDAILYAGVSADVWMQTGVEADRVSDTQALAYRQRDPEGRVCLVLGAGNVSSIGPMDALYKLFVDLEVVLYKMHPVNAYLGPLLDEGLRPLVEEGVLRIVYGGSEVGQLLCSHDKVESIHITGSDKTVEAIAFGGGAEGARRKAAGQPVLTKPILSELGNVSPVIVVPGPWSDRDLAYHAENVVTMLTNNAGFNCNATRVLVTSSSWPQREAFLAAVRDDLARVPPRRAYYPGAFDRHGSFVAAHPAAERFGVPEPDQLPWTFVVGIEPTADSPCFSTEAFCGLFAETTLAASDTADFLARATEFCNERLWGTLNATLLVHPRTAEDEAEALERALAELRYGTVSINHWGAIGYGIVVSPWGAFPGHTLEDIQSGSGVVHNTLMFSRSEKTIFRAPFRVFPKPAWFHSAARAFELGRKLTKFEAAPSLLRLPGIFGTALRG